MIGPNDISGIDGQRDCQSRHYRIFDKPDSTDLPTIDGVRRCWAIALMGDNPSAH